MTSNSIDESIIICPAGDIDGARDALLWLRGSGDRVQEELKMLSEIHAKSEKSGSPSSLKAYWAEMRRPSVLRPLLLLMTLMALMMWTGAFVVVFYGVNLIQDLSVLPPSVSSYVPAIALSGLRLVGSVAGAVLLRRGAGKRTLLLSTCAAMAAAVLSLGLFVQFRAEVAIPAALPLAMLTVYMLAFGVGVGTVPWTLLGELVPAKVTTKRSHTTSVCNRV